MKNTHIPRKRFGQNFLHDQGIINKIISAIAPDEQDNMVEIGPGQGAMTRPLLDTLPHMHAVELDRDLIALLEREFFNKLTIHNTDVLKFDFRQLVTADKPQLRVVGNLPYNISTPLLFHLLDHADIISNMTFMLQKEVVDRMVAAPNTSNYGRLSVMLQYRCAMKSLFHVPPGAFNPPPKVHSSIVFLKPYSTPPVQVDNTQHFAQLVTAAFAQRRKTLRNTLKKLLSAELITSIDIDPQARAETLSLAEFARLSNLYTQQQ